jgi:type VI secretion system secreted protein VgrG
MGSRPAVASVVSLSVLLTVLVLSFAGSALSAQASVDLGNADAFGALSFTAMTNAGANTVVNGDIGSPTSIDAGVTHPAYAAYGAGTPELAGAQASLLTAYGFAEAQTPNQPTITGMNLAGQTLAPGVYNSTSGILISGPIALTLDGGGDPNSVFIFQAASSGDLTVDPTSSVTYTNGAQPCNVFWKVNSAFLKNTDQTFVGTILALTQITLTDHITVEGRLLARNADVTFIHDVVNKPTCAVATTPSPTTTTTPAPTTTTTPAPTTTPTPPPASKTPVKLPKAKPKAIVKKTTTTPTAKKTTAKTTTSKTTTTTAKPKPKTPTATPRPPKHRFGLTG